MPSGALLGILPAFAGSLRTLHLHVRAPGITSRDLVGVGRLMQLQHLDMSVQLSAEVRGAADTNQCVPQLQGVPATPLR
jgi:hypothetical protein